MQMHPLWPFVAAVISVTSFLILWWNEVLQSVQSHIYRYTNGILLVIECWNVHMLQNNWGYVVYLKISVLLGYDKIRYPFTSYSHPYISS
jgi:hypothetical protein